MDNRYEVKKWNFRNQLLISRFRALFYLFFFLYLLGSVLLTGCGEKENKNLVNARILINQGKYAEARNDLNLALKSNPDNPEIICPLNALDIIQPGASSSAIQEAIRKIISLVDNTEGQIKKLESIDKDLLTDSDKSNLVKLKRRFELSLVPTAMILKSNTDWINGAGPSAIDLLIRLLKANDPNIQRDMVNLLVSLKDQSYTHLIEALQNDNSLVRRQAVIALGKIGSQEAVEHIANLLNDQEPGVRFYVPVSLGMIGGETIVEPLHKAMKNEMAQVRMAAATIVGKIEDQTGIDSLVELLANDNSYVKAAATNALIKIGEPAVSKMIDVLNTKAEKINLPPTDFVGDKIGGSYKKELSKRTALQISAASILGSIKDPRAIAPLMEAMKREALPNATEDEKTNAASVRAGASAALANIGPGAVEPLIRTLENDINENARLNAISILGSIGDKRAVLPLISALSDSNKNVRAGAAEALGKLKDRRATPKLIEALKDPDVVTKANAAASLGSMVDKTATKALIEVVKDKTEREKIRDSAIISLGTIKDTAALEILTKVLIDEYEKEGIRKSAAAALRTMENPWPSEALIGLLRGDIVYGVFMPKKGVISKWLKKEGDERLLKGMPLVQISAGQERIEVSVPTNGDLLKIYVKEGEEAEADALIGLISFKDKEIKQEERSSIRSVSATALGKVKGEKTLAALIHALRKDKSAAVRKNCASSLRELEKADARAVLIDALGDDSGVVRSEVAYALGVIKGADSVSPLLSVLKKDKYESARVKAAWALGEIADKRATEQLIEIIVKGRKGQPEANAVISEVITALDKIAGPAVDPLIKVMQDQAIDEIPRSRAARILGLIENTKAVEPLNSALKDKSVVVRSKAAESLGLIGDRRGVEPLINILTDENEWVTTRANAAASLGNIKDERAVAPLIKMLGSDVVDIKNNAVVALGIIKDKRATMPLIQILENEKEEDSIRANAISALNSIVDVRAIPSLVKALNSINPSIRQNAVVALGGHGASVAVSPLISIVGNQNESTALRASAADSLGSIGDRSGNSLLRSRLGNYDENDTVWISIANASGKLKIDQLPQWVKDRAQDSWESVTLRAAALMALGGTGNQADYSFVLENLDHGTKEIRSGAALSLGTAGKREAVQPLIDKLQKDGEEIVRRDSAKALASIADPSSEQALIKALKEDAKDSVKIEAANGLGNIKSGAGITALIEILQDTSRAISVRWTAASALGNIKGTSQAPTAVTALKALLDDNSGSFHFEIAEALRKLTGENFGYER